MNEDSNESFISEGIVKDRKFCNICLRLALLDDLEPMSKGGSELPQQIESALSVQLTNRSSAHICSFCVDLVHTINDFKWAAQQSQHLLSSNLMTAPDGIYWVDKTDCDTFSSCRRIVRFLKEVIEDYVKSTAVRHVDLPNNSAEASNGSNSQLYQTPTTTTTQPVISPVGQNVNQLSDSNCNDLFKEGLNIADKDITNGINTEDNMPSRVSLHNSEGKPSSPFSSTEGSAEEDNSDLYREKSASVSDASKSSSRKMRSNCRAMVPCETCGVKVRLYTMEGHQNMHLGVKPFICSHDGCVNAFHSYHQLYAHLRHHKDKDNIYDCDICGKMVKTKASLSRHRATHKTVGQYACPDCGRHFTRKAYLKSHHDVVHSGLTPQFPCEFCGFVFRSKNYRTCHIKNKHREQLIPTMGKNKYKAKKPKGDEEDLVADEQDLATDDELLITDDAEYDILKIETETILL